MKVICACATSSGIALYPDNRGELGARSRQTRGAKSAVDPIGGAVPGYGSALGCGVIVGVTDYVFPRRFSL